MFIPISTFLLLPIYTNILSPTDYGIRAIIILFIFLIQIPTSLGLNWVVRSRYFDFETEAKQKSYLTSLMLFSFFPRMLMATFVLFIGESLATLLFRSWESSFMFLLHVQILIYIVNF